MLRRYLDLTTALEPLAVTAYLDEPPPLTGTEPEP